ncbi:hypothetical protein LRP67_11615 [Nocardioides sp. cx-169]|uniref:hypothetical protein n=1 Tax=Nocardioides sp. cx-169 TaxID=2899080 RepID=UPI001E55C218|nr:hypothetical protein [Nocardioides sp. cx-169]MCD4534731.1 hypothetical protein [Nocardioides sp. cx-169]
MTFTPPSSTHAPPSPRSRGVRCRREVELAQAFLALHWCDLHSSDPAEEPGPRPPGSDRLDRLGGDGTPGVRELALCELAVACQIHALSARSLVGDLLDLRHRLPRTFERVVALDAELWLARRMASMTRDLPFEVMHLVDDAVAAAIGSQAPSRVIELCEAKRIEVDLAAHEARLEAERKRRYVGLSRRDGTGLRKVIARVSEADAHDIATMVDTVADLLADRPEHAGLARDELRAIAFGWLARPFDVLRLLAEHDRVPDSAALLEKLDGLDLTRLRPKAVVYVHVHEAALAGMPGVARVEDLGPQLLSRLADLLGHRHIRLSPVIDLNDHVSVSSYEHPEAVKERIHLLRPGDQFPHASSMSRRLDLDHPVPYSPHGPPGQTSTRTSQPLTRTNHRAKTHLGHRATPLETGEVVWRTRHGLTRLVDTAGTHVIDASEADALTGDDPLDRALARLVVRHRTGQLEDVIERHRMDGGEEG